MTNPNPSPELHDPVCFCCCRPKSEHVRKQCPETTYFIENVAALSQTPPPPSLSTDVQSAATGCHERDVSLKVAMPAPGGVASEALKILRSMTAHASEDADEIGWSKAATKAAAALEAYWARVSEYARNTYLRAAGAVLAAIGPLPTSRKDDAS
jgi:hypothetical protein